MDTDVLWEVFDWPTPIPAKFLSCDHGYGIPTEFPQAQYTSTPPRSRHPSFSIPADTPRWASNHINLRLALKRLTNSDWMKNILEEAKSALAKAKDDIAWYYNRRRSPAPSFSPGDMVYLDSEDIQTTHLSKKLSHRHLGPYPVERRIGKYAYHLILPPPMRHLCPVFNVVKLSPAPYNPIAGRRLNLPPPPELVDGEEEYIVEKILNSRMFWWKLQYLVKWEGYRIEGNT